VLGIGLGGVLKYSSISRGPMQTASPAAERENDSAATAARISKAAHRRLKENFAWGFSFTDVPPFAMPKLMRERLSEKRNSYIKAPILLSSENPSIRRSHR
jgi:hypothetical protein